MRCCPCLVFAPLYVLESSCLVSASLIWFEQASSNSQSVESAKFATHAQKAFAEDVRQVIKIASLLLSGAAEQTVRFERIILLEQFVSEAAEVWSVPNSRLFALPYSLSRTCRLSLTVRAIIAFCSCFCLELLFVLLSDSASGSI
jgi:hypothetical protein